MSRSLRVLMLSQPGRKTKIAPSCQTNDTTSVRKADRKLKKENRHNRELLTVTANTRQNQQGARVPGVAEPSQKKRWLTPQLPTPTFSVTTGPRNSCQHHYDSNIFPPQGSPCFTLALNSLPAEKKKTNYHSCVCFSMWHAEETGTKLNDIPLSADSQQLYPIHPQTKIPFRNAAMLKQNKESPKSCLGEFFNLSSIPLVFRCKLLISANIFATRPTLSETAVTSSHRTLQLQTGRQLKAAP